MTYNEILSESSGGIMSANRLRMICSKMLPKNQGKLAPQSLVLLEISTKLISNFLKFSIVEKGSRT